MTQPQPHQPADAHDLLTLWQALLRLEAMAPVTLPLTARAAFALRLYLGFALRQNPHGGEFADDVTQVMRLLEDAVGHDEAVRRLFQQAWDPR